MNDSGREIQQHLCAVCDEVACASDPSVIMTLGEAAFKAQFDHILFTILRVDWAERTLRRVYSSNTEINPLGVRKPFEKLNWAPLVIDGGRQFIGRNRDSLREGFFDHELLLSIGGQSILITPVLLRRRVVALVNTVHSAENHYREEMTPMARLFAQALLPAFVTDEAK